MTAGDREDGLICAYVIDSSGRGKPLDWPEIDSWTPDQGLLWVHVNFTKRESVQWLEERSRLAPNVRDALCADDGRPRSMQQGDGWLVMLRGINTNPGAQSDDMVAIRVWLEPHRIVSTRRRRLQSIQDIRTAIEDGHGPTAPGEFLGMLLDGLTARISASIDSLEAQIEDAETRTASETSFDLQAEIASLRRQCARLRRHISPQREALERVARQAGGCLTNNDLMAIRETIDQVVRALEDLDLARERAMVAYEDFFARVAQQQNSRIYLLSIVAAIFLPLSFLTGLFGMNVAGLPGLEEPHAFLYVSGAMLLLAVVAMAIFRWKRWI